MNFKFMSGKWKPKMKGTAAIIAIGVLCNPLAASATVSSNMPGENILNVEMPAVEEDGNSLFDFILDPQELLYRTGAARYDGGSVEEGATLLFRNREGQYDFSGSSDRLAIANKSRIPVRVTISAYITGLGETSVCRDRDFAEGEHSFYLAIVDNRGNEQPIPAEGKASVSLVMNAAEENGDCEAYSFGLAGLCNPHADWKGVDAGPCVKVEWIVEPVSSEPDSLPPEENQDEMEEQVGEENYDAED